MNRRNRSKYQKEYRSQNQRRVQEYREQNKEKAAEYREANKEISDKEREDYFAKMRFDFHQFQLDSVAKFREENKDLSVTESQKRITNHLNEYTKQMMEKAKRDGMLEDG